MSSYDERLVLDQDDHEHLIRHLGAAVIACWSELPHDIQDKILARSRVTDDEPETDDLDARLRLFVGSHLRRGGEGEQP